MYRDFEQKNRKRPLIITNIAIDKVRQVKFQGFKQCDNEFIQKQHKFLLETSKNFNDSKEVGILINTVNWNTWLILGDANRIETRDNMDAYRELRTSRKNTLLFMHNHPSTSTFSGVDFKSFCNNESLYIMTVVGNDGNVRTLTKMHDFDAHYALKMYDYLATDKYKKYDNNGTRAMREILRDCSKYGLLYKIGGKKQ